MKKIINDPHNAVAEMCNGFYLAHSDLVSYDTKHRVIYRSSMNREKVMLISGGGSGHEPSHAGFVGTGMLDAAVCGDVFASPSIMQIYSAIVGARSSRGTLLIVKNYSGDCLNFNGAADLAKEQDGMQVETVYVDDDIATARTGSKAGRRGVAGTLCVHKIAGAAAEQGCDLPEVKRIAEKVIRNVRSLGFALSSCTVPAKGTPTFSLDDDRIEFGVGIHGEAGTAQIELTSADKLAEKVVSMLLADLSLQEGDEVATIVNGFGATPLMELCILNSSIHRLLTMAGAAVNRTFLGNYMTSLDMAGASLTVLKLDDELKQYLQAPAVTPVRFS